ncbi:MAG TPA: hypothetical protein VFC19_18995 [Candidatus Limnocylindrales bacterium]|nr:hypothetical protein [Candidatus Limnocylindrales bacterium]
MKRPSMVILAAVSVLMGLGACEKVPKPTSDSTPPTLNWHVENQTTNTENDYGASGTVPGKKGDRFRVTLKAHDPEGIQKITLEGEYIRHCVSGNLGQNGNGLYAPMAQTLAPDSDGKVLTQIFLIESYDPDITCSGGYLWQYTTITLDGSGTNYFNGAANGTLTISIEP